MKNRKYVPMIVIARRSDDFTVRLLEKVLDEKQKVLNRYKKILTEQFGVPFDKVGCLDVVFNEKINKDNEFAIGFKTDKTLHFTTDTANAEDCVYLNVLFQESDMRKFCEFIVDNEEDYCFYYGRIKPKSIMKKNQKSFAGMK